VCLKLSLPLEAAQGKGASVKGTLPSQGYSDENCASPAGRGTAYIRYLADVPPTVLYLTYCTQR